jgi:hypothetical protein
MAACTQNDIANNKFWKKSTEKCTKTATTTIKKYY